MRRAGVPARVPGPAHGVERLVVDPRGGAQLHEVAARAHVGPEGGPAEGNVEGGLQKAAPGLRTRVDELVVLRDVAHLHDPQVAERPPAGPVTDGVVVLADEDDVGVRVRRVDGDRGRLERGVEVARAVDGPAVRGLVRVRVVGGHQHQPVQRVQPEPVEAEPRLQPRAREVPVRRVVPRGAGDGQVRGHAVVLPVMLPVAEGVDAGLVEVRRVVRDRRALLKPGAQVRRLVGAGGQHFPCRTVGAAGAARHDLRRVVAGPRVEADAVDEERRVLVRMDPRRAVRAGVVAGAVVLQAVVAHVRPTGPSEVAGGAHALRAGALPARGVVVVLGVHGHLARVLLRDGVEVDAPRRVAGGAGRVRVEARLEDAARERDRPDAGAEEEEGAVPQHLHRVWARGKCRSAEAAADEKFAIESKTFVFDRSA